MNLFPALFPWKGLFVCLKEKKLSLPVDIPRTAVFLSFFQDGVSVAVRRFAASVGVLPKALRRNRVVCN